MDNMKFETMDEMVFADRNKAYGAYQLRKTYNRYLAYATGRCV